MANFVSPNQVQLQIGLVILVRPDTCDDTSQPYPYPTIMCDRSGILGLKFSYLSTLQKKLSERRQNARLSTTTTAVNSPSFGDEMRSISLEHKVGCLNCRPKSRKTARRPNARMSFNCALQTICKFVSVDFVDVPICRTERSILSVARFSR